MGFVATRGLYLPRAPTGSKVIGNTTTALTQLLLDALADRIAFVFRVPKTGNLKRVGFRYGAITTFQNLKVSFQDVLLTTGAPDGTIDQFRVVSSGTANTWQYTGIISSDGTDTGVKRSVTKGDLLAVVIQFDTVAGSLEISDITHDTATLNQLAYTATDLAGTGYAKDTNSIPIVGVEYDDATGYYFIDDMFPVVSVDTLLVNSGSDPDEVALKFRMPFPCKVGGAWFGGDIDGDVEVVLYEGTTVKAGPVAVDKDTRKTGGFGAFTVEFDEVEIIANTDYYLALKPTTVTSINVTSYSVDAAAIFEQISGPGTSGWRWDERLDAGAWKNQAGQATKRPFIGVMLTALHDGVAGISAARAVNGV